MEEITSWLWWLRNIIWSPPLLILLVFVGAYMTYRLGGLQFRYLGDAFRLALRRSTSTDQGDISAFQALMTALAGAVGTGSIAGIATAVTIGGFGSLFWMWVIALLGMATTYSETLLSIKFRKMSARGEMLGGPMQTLHFGVGSKILAILFSIFGALAAFGIGTTVQTNSMSEALRAMAGLDPFWTGVIMTVIASIVILGGVQTIGKVVGYLVPFMATAYLMAGSIVLIQNIENLPAAFSLIVSSAFTGQAAVGGFAGSSIIMAIQMGVSRGIFSNESGLGSLSLAAAAAKIDRPVTQGLICMSGTFLATFVVCTITGLVLAVTGVQGMVNANGQPLTGASLAIEAFKNSFVGGEYVVLLSLFLFAFTTLLAWAYYGEKCCEYLFGSRSTQAYRVCYLASIIPGAMLPLEIVWAFADIMNGLMAVPNLISILCLSNVVVRETAESLQEPLDSAPSVETPITL